MQQFQELIHSPHSSSPSQVSQSNRSPFLASSETATLLTLPQSLATHHDMIEHSHSQGTQGKPQRLTSDVSRSLTEPHMPQHWINSIVRQPRLDLHTFSGNVLEWQPFLDGFNATVNPNPSISDLHAEIKLPETTTLW